MVRSEFGNIRLKGTWRGLREEGTGTVRCFADLVNNPGKPHIVDIKGI